MYGLARAAILEDRVDMVRLRDDMSRAGSGDLNWGFDIFFQSSSLGYAFFPGGVNVMGHSSRFLFSSQHPELENILNTLSVYTRALGGKKSPPSPSYYLERILKGQLSISLDKLSASAPLPLIYFQPIIALLSQESTPCSLILSPLRPSSRLSFSPLSSRTWNAMFRTPSHGLPSCNVYTRTGSKSPIRYTR